MRDFVKRQVEIVGSVVVLGGAFSAALMVFGGQFPPWPTLLRFERLEAEVQRMIVAKRFAECEDWNHRIETAQIRLSKDPGSEADRFIISQARYAISMIIDCRER